MGNTAKLFKREFPHMSRQRFVKLLMGYGYSRNTANRRAQRYQERGMKYSFAWWIERYSTGLFYS